MILGIDVAKDKLDIYCLPTQQHYQIKNSLASIKQFLKQHRKACDIAQVVFESTGGHEKLLTLSLIDLEIAYHKAHPKRVYHFGQGEGCFAKTDRIDARLLAQYGQAKHPAHTTTETRQSIELKELSSRKQQIKNSIADEKRRLSSVYLNKGIVRSIKNHIRFLEQQLCQIEKQVDELVHNDERLLTKRNLLVSVKGVGKEVSTLLISELPELGSLSREAISALVGVAPRTQDSGRTCGYRSIRYGRFDVRKGLYMAALVASRHNPRMRAIYTKLISKGKKCKVALVAVMRKMLIMMNAMIKKNEMWHAERI